MSPASFLPSSLAGASHQSYFIFVVSERTDGRTDGEGSGVEWSGGIAIHPRDIIQCRQAAIAAFLTRVFVTPPLPSIDEWEGGRGGRAPSFFLSSAMARLFLSTMTKRE